MCLVIISCVATAAAVALTISADQGANGVNDPDPDQDW